jgi:hypothetical protein
LHDAVQQDLNPGLTNYPNFVAGEAVKAVVSPDGNTLAILTAGMNSLYHPNTDCSISDPTCLIGKVDAAASTQFLFLYDLTGANKSKPVLKQVIQQTNAHVGLVWAPNSQTLYAAGGCDDAVYAYANNGSSFLLSAKISLGHAPNGCVSGAANQKGLGLSVEPNVAGLGILSAAEADAQARFALDEEGTLHGRKPGVVNGLVDLGYAYFLGKVSDDISETPIRAIGATMSDAAVANAARYVGL